MPRTKSELQFLVGADQCAIKHSVALADLGQDQATC